jgi:acetolactate decarboxylase
MSHVDPEIAFAAAVAAHRQSANRIRHDEHAHEYYQTSLVSALMSGVYDGELTIGELKRHGDFGIGTFNGLDGEMIVIDGAVYRLTGDGQAAVAEDGARTPYAAVIRFAPDITRPITAPCEKAAFERRLDAFADSPNLFYAVRVDGRFSQVKIRNVVRQTPPYKPLLEAVKEQAVRELSDVEGTMIGFRCPDYAVGIGVPGYHLHFIRGDRRQGGHVMDYRIEGGALALDHTSSLHLELPETSSFNHADLTGGASAGDIHKVEN